jgi:hypothetical protein
VGDRTSTVIRRAASVAAVAGSVAVGMACAATLANAGTVCRNEASVLTNVTPAETGLAGPDSRNVGCPQINGGCRGAAD